MEHVSSFCPNYWAWSLGTKAIEPACPRTCAPQEKAPQWEASIPQLQSNPHSQQLGQSPHSNEGPPQSKQNKTKIPFKSINQLEKKKKQRRQIYIKTQRWGQLPWPELGETGEGSGGKEETWKMSGGFARLQRWQKASQAEIRKCSKCHRCKTMRI